jgi:hypothetical protein
MRAETNTHVINVFPADEAVLGPRSHIDSSVSSRQSSLLKLSFGEEHDWHNGLDLALSREHRGITRPQGTSLK